MSTSAPDRPRSFSPRRRASSKSPRPRSCLDLQAWPPAPGLRRTLFRQLRYYRRMKSFVLAVVASVVVLNAAERQVPRTRDGRPDLHGTWSYATLTTLERPSEFANKPFL